VLCSTLNKGMENGRQQEVEWQEKAGRKRKVK
jgi:hypothetical protein